MVVFVAIHAWPIFHYNGLSWLGSGGNVGRQLAEMQTTTQHPPPSAYHLRAWPLVYGTILTTTVAVVFALAISILSSIFIVELAPARLRRIAIPVIRLLASVPSVIDGLVFLFEPLRTLASGIVDFREGIGAPALGSTLYAWALLLLFAAFVLSVGGYLIKLPLRKYQVRG